MTDFNVVPPNDQIPKESDENRPHKPADDREEVYFHGAPMLRGELAQFMGFILLGVVLILLPFVIDFFRPSNLPWWVYAILILLGLAVMVIPILRVKSVGYRISNYRIDYERGILSKSIDTLELWHVEDIKFHQSFFDRLLKVGTITILSHDETTPRLDLHGLPNPRPLFEQLKQRVIAVKRQRGVVKMDVG
jgi:membrane protein YdbS with pleckstrin-like domain